MRPEKGEADPSLSLAKKICFAAVTRFLFFGLLELGSRLIAPVVPRDSLYTQDDETWADTREADPLLFWRLRPSFDIGEFARTNSLGLRGAEIPLKASTEFRILSLGESSTFARRIPDDATYSAVLEETLQVVQGRTVRVVNAGVPGYSLFQGTVLAEQLAATLEPDAIMLYFGFNDLLSAAYRAERSSDDTARGTALTDRRAAEAMTNPAARAVGALASASNLVRLALDARSGRGNGEVRKSQSVKRVPSEDRIWLLDRMRALCQERGIELVIIVPWYREFTAHRPVLVRYAQQNEIPIVDLEHAISGHSKARESYFLDKVHPTVEGHGLIGRAIAESLRAYWPR